MKYSTTYLHFDGACRAAMTFYQHCFGGELEIRPMPDAIGEPGLRVMHAALTRDGRPVLMACDTPDGEGVSGRNCSIVVESDSGDELERLFAAVGEGGEVTLPLSDMEWGTRFGMLTDQFGIHWMFNWEPPKANGAP